MRAGNLDRHIVIEEPYTVTRDQYRTSTTDWRKRAAVRAQMLEFDTSNREGVRATTDARITFRIYWLHGLTLEHRVLYEGQSYKIQKIREVGRRAGLDLVVERVGP